MITFHLTAFSQKKGAAKDAQHTYFPAAHNWLHRSIKASGLDSVKLHEAIRFAKEHESKAPRSMELSHVMSFGKEPFGEGIGPLPIGVSQRVSSFTKDT